MYIQIKHQQTRKFLLKKEINKINKLYQKNDEVSIPKK
jgi:hypothetical protein